MSSIEITKEKIIVKKIEEEGNFHGKIFDKNELTKINVYLVISQLEHPLFSLEISEDKKTRVKIENFPQLLFKRLIIDEEDEKCLNIYSMLISF